MAVEYMSFEEVLKELQVDKEELLKLVSQGELRGFRDGKAMKFKKEDVLNLKKGRETEPTIILTDSDQEMGIAESSDELILDESTSDTVLNIGDIMSPEKQEEEIVFSDSTEEFSISPHDSDPEAAIPTVEVPSVGEDMGISGETESDAQLVAAKSAPELGATTEAKAVSGGFKPPSSEDIELATGDIAEDEEQVAVAPRKTQSGKISRSARLRAMQMKQQPAGAVWSVVAVVAIGFLVLPGSIVLNRIQSTSPEWVANFASTMRNIVGAIFEGVMG